MSELTNVDLFDADGEWKDSGAMDNTCPDCGADSIVSYIDRHSSYEYCTDCDWSDEGDFEAAIEPISRTGRLREEA